MDETLEQETYAIMGRNGVCISVDAFGEPINMNLKIDHRQAAYENLIDSIEASFALQYIDQDEYFHQIQCAHDEYYGNMPNDTW